MSETRIWSVFDLLNDQITLIVQSVHPVQWSSVQPAAWWLTFHKKIKDHMIHILEMLVTALLETN